MPERNATSNKQLGDAGEHFALSQFSFCGRPAAKMPDNWPDYDLVVQDPRDGRLHKISVKTRSESAGWKTSKFFTFNTAHSFDWLVLVFKPSRGAVEAWVIPRAEAEKHASLPGPTRKDRQNRDLSWSKLTKGPLADYRGNWELLD